MSTHSLDVICLGRAAVDLYGQQIGGPLEDMQSFAKYLGGSSGNLAVGLARLGTASAMLTRVGDEHMGRFVCQTLAQEGVDTSHVVTDPARLTGLVILGISGKDEFPHIFYRHDCADMALNCGDFDEAYIASSRALAITGTHLSTEQTLQAVNQAVRFAGNNDTRVILDIDYRPVLWGLGAAGDGAERFVQSDQATQRLQSLIPHCDLVVGTEEEICIAGGSTDTLKSLAAIRERSSAVIVLKRGPLGCSVFDSEIPTTPDDGISVTGVSVEVLNVLGAGDAFLSGFLDAWLRDCSLEECARRANACGALVVSRHGCSPAMPSAVELDYYLHRASEIPRPDLHPEIERLHRVSTGHQTPGQLFVLAFDHRRQLEELVQTIESPAGQISRFKTLVAAAALEVAEGFDRPECLGVILDERYGQSLLENFTRRGLWVGRPVEVPGSRPLELDPDNNIGLHLQTWPASHVVKCLVFYHPDDPLQLRLTQERRVRQLFNDCTALGRELLLELIITSQNQPVEDTTLANAMRRFYNLGVFPAWWKLEAQSQPGWEAISTVIDHYDPHCRGVLLLGLDAPGEQLRESFNHAAGFDHCKGFAVGRSIFGEAARLWFQGQLSDSRVVAQVADNYHRMIGFWQEASQRS